MKNRKRFIGCFALSLIIVSGIFTVIESRYESKKLEDYQSPEEIFLQNESRFRELAEMLINNNYQIYIYYDHRDHNFHYSTWSDELRKNIESLELLDSETIDAIKVFLNDFNCDSVNSALRPDLEEWIVYISFFDSPSNSGIVYFENGLSEDSPGYKYYKQLSENWYFYILPAV